MTRGRWVALIAIVIAAAVAFGVSRRTRRKVPLRIATGQQGGTFLPLGEALATAFVQDKVPVTPTVLLSPGSDASVDMIERGEVDLALVSSNSRAKLRTMLIAPLYPEQLQIVVRKASRITQLAELAGKKFSVGPSGSGTETIAQQVLDHFGVARSAALNMTPLEAADQLEHGTLDAAFIVAGLRAPVVARLMSHDDLELLSLGTPGQVGGALEGIGIDAPYLLPSVIPERAYGAVPTRPIGTIGVKALLVARADLDQDLVYDLAESLFRAKVRLAEKERLLARMTEKFDVAESPFPLHPGADRYLRRDDPSLIQKYTDQISLGITVAAILWSAVLALRAWRRNAQKGRIETYFAKLAELSAALRKASTDDERAAVHRDLDALKTRALQELAAEKLEPGPAFRVLQEELRALDNVK
jgi:uncharacterized protein